jgi:lipopolysaccharide export system protein LptA
LWPIVLLALMSLAATAEAQQSGPVDVQAENFEHDDQRNASHLQGNVRIARGELVVNADEAFAYRGDNGYERIELFGAPVNWRTVTEEGGETTGRADQVVYDLLERTVTLIGAAYIEEPRGTFSGDRLVYDLDSQSPRGEGNIRMTFEPEAVDATEAPEGESESEGEPAPDENEPD